MFEGDPVLSPPDSPKETKGIYSPMKSPVSIVHSNCYEKGSLHMGRTQKLVPGLFSGGNVSEGLTDTDDDNETERRASDKEGIEGLEPPNLDCSLTPWRTEASHDADCFLRQSIMLSPVKPRSPIPLSERDATTSGSTAVSAGFEVEHLRKQLTTYKIKVKALTQLMKQSSYEIPVYNNNTQSTKHLYEKFIEAIHETDETNIDRLKTTNDKLKLDLDAKDKELIFMREELLSTRNEYENMLEEVNTYMEHADSITDDINRMMTLFLENLELDVAERDALSKACDLGANYLDLKIRALLKTFYKFLEIIKRTPLGNNLVGQIDATSHNSQEGTSTINDGNGKSMKASLELPRVIDPQVELSIEAMHKEYHSFFNHVRNKMSENDDIATQINSKLSKQRSLLNKLTAEVSSHDAERISNSSSTVRIDSFSSTLNGLNFKASKDLSKSYKDHIETLTSMLNRYKSEIHDKDVEIDELRVKLKREQNNVELEDFKKQALEESITYKNQITGLENRITELKAALNSTSDDKNLIVQELEQVKQELKDESEEKAKQLHDLKVSLKLAMRKSNFCLNEKHSLQQKLRDIEEQYSILVKENIKFKQNITTVNHLETFDECESAFGKLKGHLLIHLRKMFKIFDNILQQDSISQAIRKLDKVDSIDTSMGCDKVLMKLESIYIYIENATDSIVDEHIKLLLREKDKRQKRISHISQGSEDSENYDQHLRLRIDELTRKWSAERERRKLESEAAVDRIRLLEEENFELRERVLTAKRDND